MITALVLSAAFSYSLQQILYGRKCVNLFLYLEGWAMLSLQCFEIRCR